MRLSKKYSQVCFSFLMSSSISGAISLFFTLKSFGISEFSLSLWILGSWVYAFVIAFPMSYFLPKYIHKLLKMFEEHTC